MNGTIFCGSSVRLADVTDGTGDDDPFRRGVLREGPER